MDNKVLLGNRYELIEKIGTGGMAHVYKARCHSLNRFVAVKILKPEYVSNEDFIRKFKDEAKSAASLTHPNIVSVYDVGYENDIYYIVMEYIDGITLKDFISQKKILKWKDAMIITRQIVSAIEAAHKFHIVHRDIKPHNIMLTKEGTAKVTDFGIAKAVSDSTIQVSESNMGSVHYLSPEQARGGYVDERSDLYSIGITLYEMLTGTVPFDGDTSVCVAMKHINETVVPPIEINKNIPAGVNDFVVKATRKEPRLRYQTATEMLADIQVVLLSPNAPLADSRSSGATEQKNSASEEGAGVPERNLPDTQAPEKSGIDIASFAKHTAVILLSLIISFVMLILSAGVMLKRIDPLKEKEYIIESYVGRNIIEVENLLESAGFNVEKNYIPMDDQAPNTIISQKPKVGIIKKNGVFTFNVSSDVNGFPVEDYSNKDMRIVEEAFKDNGVSLKIIDEYSDNIREGYVIGTRPSQNSFVYKGDTLVIYRSKGKALLDAPLPDLTGKTQDEALQMLKNMKLNVSLMPYVKAEPTSTEQPSGTPTENPTEKPEETQAIIENEISDNTSTVSPGDTASPGDTTGTDGNTTEEPTAEPTEEPTTNEPTATPAPSPTQDPNEGKYVAAQYPAAGTKLMAGDTVVIYMAPIERYRDKQTITLNKEQDMNISGGFTLKIEMVPSDTKAQQTIFEGVMDESQLPYSFEVQVPRRGHTDVNIYINGSLYCRYIKESAQIKK